MPANKRFPVNVQYACADEEGLPNRRTIRSWVRAALGKTGKTGETKAGGVTVRFVDADEGRRLNHYYRGKDHATNVLSFAYQSPPRLAGDLVLCVPIVAREAAEQDKSLTAHCAHLIVHGVLHLQGYDHDRTSAEALGMERAERRILAALGFPDPYADQA